MALLLVEDFLTQGLYLRGWSPRTVRTYRQGLTSFDSIAHGELTKAALQRWVVALRQKGLAPGGINMYARTINSYLSWLHSEGHLTERLKVKLLPAPPKPVRAISDQDIARILRFKPKGRIQVRGWTVTVLLLDTGLRIDEVLGLERANVDLENLMLRVNGKGSKQRLVPISMEGRKHLYRWMQTPYFKNAGGKWMFAVQSGTRMNHRNLYRDVVMLCERIGVTSRVHPHAFRHCFAVNYIRRGGDIYRLSRILGHASISTTQIYLRSMGIEHLRENHDSLSPITAA